MASVFLNQQSNEVPTLSASTSSGGSNDSTRGDSRTPPAQNTGDPELSVQGRAPAGSLPPGAGKDIASAFKLLADETRLRILSFLVEEKELNVRSLCERLDQSQPAVSHHLALMRQAGMIASRRQGKNNFYRLIPQRMAEIRDLVGELFLKDTDEFRAAM
jgi:DNA-binding transcriptional ArsR family regulator